MLGTAVAPKGVFRAYLFIILTFTCQQDQLIEVCSGRLKKGGVRCGTARQRGVFCSGTTRKMGVLAADLVKKGGLYCGTYLY